MLVIVPPQSYYEVVEKHAYSDGYFAFWSRYLAADQSFCQAGECLILPTWNHLWFVAYLLVYTLLAVLLLAAARERFLRSEEHTSELQSLMRISYAVFCLKTKNQQQIQSHTHNAPY